MKPDKVIIFLGLVLAVISVAAGFQTYYAREGDEHGSAAAIAADAAAQRATAEEITLKAIVNSDHATTARRDEQLGTILTEIHTLLTNGKSASALNAKAAKEDAAAGDKIITKVEGQLSNILANSHVNHSLICYLVQQDGAPKALVQLDCTTAP